MECRGNLCALKTAWLSLLAKKRTVLHKLNTGNGSFTSLVVHVSEWGVAIVKLMSHIMSGFTFFE